MEFFATTMISASAADLQHRLTIASLTRWCNSIEKVLSAATSNGEIYCVWGTFKTNRENLTNGVRFSLPGCINALQWTVTTGHDPNPLLTVIHVTINRTEQDQDFVDSIQQFATDWKIGLETHW